MTADTKIVLGRTVTGDVTIPQNHDVEQKPGEEFLPLLDAILTLENVDSVRWTQYTPYFNDGEPCIFSTGELTVKLVDGDETAGDYQDGYLDTSDMVTYPAGYRNPPTINPGFEELYPALKALADQVEHFEEFLLVSFGDHAEVTATTEGFNVDFYEHD